jgi:hypothetical protein
MKVAGICFSGLFSTPTVVSVESDLDEYKVKDAFGIDFAGESLQNEELVRKFRDLHIDVLSIGLINERTLSIAKTCKREKVDIKVLPCFDNMNIDFNKDSEIRKIIAYTIEKFRQRKLIMGDTGRSYSIPSSIYWYEDNKNSNLFPSDLYALAFATYGMTMLRNMEPEELFSIDQVIDFRDRKYKIPPQNLFIE